MRILTIIVVIALTQLHSGTAVAQAAQQGSAYQILETLEHNASYFTQGLEVSDGLMYESAGRYGESRVRKYKPNGDSTLVEQPIDDNFFAEGLTLFGDELYLLTWKEQTLLVLNPDDFQTKREIKYSGEGWGLASNGAQLIMSDGSDTIYFRDPESFEIEREIQVRSGQHSVRRINELEFAEGYLWANIWRSPVIVKINPSTGNVVDFFDLSGLVLNHSSGYDERVLNGIAYDAERKAYWITGKLWPKRYLVSFE